MKFKEHEVVISGIGAKLPESSNIKEFGEKLFSKSCMLKRDLVRWIPAVMEKPYMSGRIPDSDKFDYTFFGVPSKLVNNSDPQMAQMLERSYEAIVDAGVNPVTLKGHNVCVVAATTLSDSEILRTTEGIYLDGYGMVGHSRTMMANRISYCLNLTGPSYSINSSWVSAVQGLEVAASLVGQGLCESAIVTACNLLFLSSVETEYKDLNFLAPDGKCSPFDSNAKGFARSEATVTFFLQRAQDAKRHYCTVLKSQVQYLGGNPSSFIAINPKLEQFYKDFYRYCKVNPSEVSYIEAFGVCDKDYDSWELNSISNVFCNGRSPTLIGSVTGNVGNAECPSGFVSLVKSIIAMETGQIPPTIGYNTPNRNIQPLVTGQLKAVRESTALPGNLIAVNCLSFTGNVGHILVKRHNKTKRTLSLGQLPLDRLPRLVVLQTRHEEGAKAIIDMLSNMPVDTEYISLINGVFKTSIPNYLWRSYITLPVKGKKQGQAKIENVSTEKRSLWFVFSGMGSQWPGMGKDLLQIPLFAASINRCDKALAPYGINIRFILTTNNPATFDNILNCFVGIAAIQVGLIDVLRAVGVTPDGIIGHSVGELGCAYADGCLTAEEMVLAAYFRGKASLESENIKGMMAAVGLGFNEIKNELPPTIDVACHNSATSCTLSGPTNDVLEFVEELKNKKVFAKAVSAGGIAFHSRYIKEIGHKLLTYLRQVIKDPKPRSARWISTSVSQDQWNTPDAQLCSAEYHTNNLLGSVLFEEGCQHLPENIILLEVAPHGLLQAILRRSISSESINLAMTNRTAESNSIHLLEVLGKLHNQGIDVDVNALYPPIQYPVSRGTPSLADLVTWDHGERFYHGVQELSNMMMKGSSETIVDINQKHPDYPAWQDHCIRGSTVVPLSYLLMYSWNYMFKARGLDVDQQNIIVEDVIISDSVAMNSSDCPLLITFTPGTFLFEISKDTSTGLQSNVILKGRITAGGDMVLSTPALSEVDRGEEGVPETEIYSILAHYGCRLGPQFQQIKKIVLGDKVCFAQVQWTGSLVTFLDALFKVTVLVHSEKELTLMQPCAFSRLIITPTVIADNSLVDVYYDLRSKTLVCEAVELCGIKLSHTSTSNPAAICWREIKIQAHGSIKFSLEEFLSRSIQLASQTGLSPWAKKSSQLHIVVLNENNGTSVLFMNILNDVMKTLSYLTVKLRELDLKDTLEHLKQVGSQGCLLVGQYNKLVSFLDTSSEPNVYCLTYSTTNDSPSGNSRVRSIMSYQSKGGYLSLLKRKSITVQLTQGRVCEVDSHDCVERLDSEMNEDISNDYVIIMTSAMTPRDLLPILANKHYARRLCTVFILDKKAPRFSLESSFYNSEISVGLPVNILHNGAWSTLVTSDIEVWPHTKNVDRLIHSSDESLEVICTGLNLNTFTLNQEYNINKMDLTCADFSGYMKKERVMGVAECDSVWSLTPDDTLRWSVPPDWSLEQAASVPVIYTLAYYCVLIKGCVKAGEDVLVHAGMSPIGQAVIGIALQIGANVITTVTNEDEAVTLLKLHPTLNSKSVILLGSEDVFVAVCKLTAGKGVEVVVNCLRGSDMISSIKAMGCDCRFLHLGLIQIEDRESIGMLVFLKQTSFFGVNLDNITSCSHNTKVLLQKALEQGINQGVVKPLPVSTFNFKDEENALLHLREKKLLEKTILINDRENKMCPKRVEDFCYSNGQSVIVLGTTSALWLDVAEWLILRGARDLVVFVNDGNDLMKKHTSRFSRLVNRFNTTIRLLPESRLLTADNAMQVLEEVTKHGQVVEIFCIEQNESDSAMRNLDLASRKILPELRQFVSLLGEGAAVSESRAASGLPVCSVRSESPLINPAHVLRYLSNLPADFSSKSRFFSVSDKLNSIDAQDSLNFEAFLPTTLGELCRLADSVSETPVFSEDVTLSPGHSERCNSLIPVFVISALGSHSLTPLLRHVIHPAFCSSLPASITSVNEYAEMLMHSLLKIQRQSPFNLLGTSWGGPVAITLANLLEAKGHHVRLFLLEGAPILICNRIRALCERYSCDLGPSLLTETLKLPLEVLKHISQFDSWEDQLKVALLEAKISPELQQRVGKALTCLYNQLNTLIDQETHDQVFHGDLTLITYKPVSESHRETLAQLCAEIPKIVTIEDECYPDFLANLKTSAAINENLAFEWKL